MFRLSCPIYFSEEYIIVNILGVFSMTHRHSYHNYFRFDLKHFRLLNVYPKLSNFMWTLLIHGET
jgi:hypothetical protein